MNCHGGVVVAGDHVTVFGVSTSDDVARRAAADVDSSAVGRDGRDTEFSGSAQVIPPLGASIITDIDDTIKHTGVCERRQLLENTFLKPFEPVAGMAQLYQKWAAEGAAFHYVSSSPWQIHGCLQQFFADEGFPAGSLHLRTMRLRGPSLLQLMVAGKRSKKKAIKTLIKSFPHRKFVLIGDAGEKDPEIYGAMARRFPGQVAKICIRQLPGQAFAGERVEKSFRDLPPQIWQVFQKASDLANIRLAEPLA